MARLRSPEKRRAILEAAVEEIAQAGLSAPTSRIARRAEVAEGTLFTYFATKDDLLNQLYLELKAEFYDHVNPSFPEYAPLRDRAWHIWSKFVGWSLERPLKRKVSVQLNVSDVITQKTRAQAALGRELIDATFKELAHSEAVRGLPPSFAGSVMSSFQEAALDLVAKQPKQHKQLIERTFNVFWRIFEDGR